MRAEIRVDGATSPGIRSPMEQENYNTEVGIFHQRVSETNNGIKRAQQQCIKYIKVHVRKQFGVEETLEDVVTAKTVVLVGTRGKNE